MAGASDPFSILNKGGQDNRFIQVQKKQNVNRYWRGVVPVTNPEDEEDDDLNIFPEARSFSSLRTEKMEERMKEFEKPSEMELELEDIKKSEQAEKEEEEARKRVMSKRRQVQKSQIVSEVSEVSAEVQTSEQQRFQKPEERIKKEMDVPVIEGEVKVENRMSGRAAAKERLLQKQKEEEKLKLLKAEQKTKEINEKKANQMEEEDGEDQEHEDESEDDEEEESDEEESEEEEENRPVYKMMKPVYISKAERDFQSKVDIEEQELEEEKKKIEEIAKQQNKIIVMEQKKLQIQAEEDANKSDDSRQGQEFLNDDDDLNKALEEEQWKIRELKRIRKDREEQQVREAELAEMERRARLTNEELIAEDKRLGLHQKVERRQYAFMQKYYHKGAFYQEDNELLQRDFNMPVGEELVDKSVLPDILQKRRGNFGKKGQSKYTHLTDQDTTNFDPKQRVDQNLQQKMFSKMAGLKGSNSKIDPRHSRR